jgi:hypothetical protein
VAEILEEVDNPRQRAGEPRRRWFAADDLDLIVWVDDRGRPIGFQLCYGRRRAERALTWTPEQGYRHTAIDDGERGGLGYKAAPILVPDGPLDARGLERRLREAGGRLPADVGAFVLERLRAHPAYAGAAP